MYIHISSSAIILAVITDRIEVEMCNVHKVTCIEKTDRLNIHIGNLLLR